MSNDYYEYNLRMYNLETEFEKTFPVKFVSLVGKSFLFNTRNVTFDKVLKICKEYNLTYSKYQQMESLYLAKLSRRIIFET